MCGLTGFFDSNSHSTAELLLKMTDAVAHRGPDGQGHYFAQSQNGQIGLGHRRLSIIDLSVAANQPMHFDGLHLVFNGEIYNYSEIREELIRLGHQFKTHSDTEVILHAWRQWGESAIHQWRGMFAIALYDERSNELILIRDRPGVKPLHYYWQDGLFLFGSELKSLMAHPRFTRQLDPASLALFLQYGHVSSPHCIFKHTHKLLPGHLMRLKLNDRSLITKQYWNVYDHYNQPKLNISLPEAIRETEQILSDSFRYRMVSDVQVGVFLSGGYDSTCVTALLQKQYTDKIRTFTIGSTDNELDEAPFARQIAERLGTEHTEYYCSAKEALDIIPDLPYYYDEPFADSSAIPTILVSRLARKQVTVALSADGGDELFAGYNRYDYISRYAKKIGAIPLPIRKLIVSLMNGVSSESIPGLRSQPLFHSRYKKLKNLLNDPGTRELMKNLNQVFTAEELSPLIQVHGALPKTLYDSTEFIDPESDPISFMMAVDYQTYLPDDIMTKVDRATMSIGLEGREPFLDQNIIEWVAKLPTHYKYHEGQKKYLLKQIVHQYIPETMMERPKMGFAVPVKEWLLTELKPLVTDMLSENRLQAHGLLDPQAVEKLLNQFYAGRSEHYLRIWYLLMFQMWYNRWMH